MNYKFAAVLFLLLMSLGCTAWAAEAEPEPEPVTCEVNLFQCGSLEGAQTIPGQVTLLDSEEEAYQRIYQGLVDKLEEIELYDLRISVEEGKALFERVVNDNPELFYIENRYGYSYMGDYLYALIPEYMEGLPDDAGARMSQAMERALAVLEPGMSQMEQALLLHDYLVVHVTYNWSVATTGVAQDKLVYTTYGALANGDAVCQGYAEAYQLLLKQCGIQSVVVSSSNMNHAWNLVEIDGSWYHVDTTWDDPVPDLPGYCRHENFLRSDAGIATAGSGKGHFGWTVPEGIQVAEEEPELIIRTTDNSVYRYEEHYYYLEAQHGAGKLYRAASITDKEPELVTDSLSLFFHSSGGYYFNQYSVVWRQGILYYVNRGKTLTAYDLNTGSATGLGSIPFTAADAADGAYPSAQDAIGLVCDEDQGQLVAVSKTRPEEVLATFQLTDYPPAWEVLPTEETTLAGGLLRDHRDTLQVGLVWAEEAAAESRLLAALYQDGQLVDLREVTSDSWTPGLNVLELSLEDCPAYDRLTLFLLSGDAVPHCGSVEVWTPTS